MVMFLIVIYLIPILPTIYFLLHTSKSYDMKAEEVGIIILGGITWPFTWMLFAFAAVSLLIYHVYEITVAYTLHMRKKINDRRNS